ncbi:MAG: hypothetical protein QOJ98_1281 [Acidobacteriota bacterium]|nr:hypothetical protein [Acidobacteriota bacterium]
MRKRYRVLVLAALVAALVVPVGYALSIDSAPKAQRTRYAVAIPAAATVVVAPRVLPRVADAAPNSLMSPFGDSAKLLCIGTVLFGLAAAVRKAI